MQRKPKQSMRQLMSRSNWDEDTRTNTGDDIVPRKQRFQYAITVPIYIVTSDGATIDYTPYKSYAERSYYEACGCNVTFDVLYQISGRRLTLRRRRTPLPRSMRLSFNDLHNMIRRARYGARNAKREGN